MEYTHLNTIEVDGWEIVTMQSDNGLVAFCTHIETEFTTEIPRRAGTLRSLIDRAEWNRNEAGR